MEITNNQVKIKLKDLENDSEMDLPKFLVIHYKEEQRRENQFQEKSDHLK
jgi:hypothetical protein